MWQWFNFLAAQVPSGKTVLKINLDETAICLYQGEGKGNILLSKKRPRGEAEVVQRVPHSRRRTYLTHVAFVCDQAELQHLLPQVVIGNERVLPAAAMPALRASLPSNVRLIRQKSSWNNSTLCAIIVRMLALALGPHRERFQPVLLLDTVRLHFNQVVLNACNACGIWLILVPARTTWLLQPLDTHVFRAFKDRLRKAYQKARLQAATHDLNVQQFMPCLYEAIRVTMDESDWSSSFSENGFGQLQAQVKESIRRELAMDQPLCIPSARPTLEQLQCVFPKRTVVPTASLWRPFDPPSAPSLARSSASSARVVFPRVGAVAVLGRTRSQTQQLRVSDGSVAAAAPLLRAARGQPLRPRRPTAEGQ